MGALRGSLTYSRFTVDGALPRDFRSKCVQAARLRVFEPLRPEDEEQERSGWCVVDRPFDLELTREKIFQGPHLVLGFRVDRWRIPSALLKAHIAEQADKALAKSGREKLGKRELAELKATVTARLRRKSEPSSKVIDVCWHLDAGVVRIWTHSRRVLEDFAALFEKTFGFKLVFESPYSAAERAGLGRSELEALRRVLPTPFHGEPTSAPIQRIPSANSDLAERIETTRFLGSEFLTWLWCTSELCNGTLELGARDAVELWFIKLMDFGSPLDPAERITVRGAAPSAAPEAREALRQGKLPIKARLSARREDQEFTWQLVAPTLAIAGATIPAVLANDSEAAFIERMELIEQLEGTVFGLYNLFLRLRLADAWDGTALPTMRGWAQSAKVDTVRYARLLMGQGDASASARDTRRKAKRAAPVNG